MHSVHPASFALAAPSAVSAAAVPAAYRRACRPDCGRHRNVCDIRRADCATREEASKILRLSVDLPIVIEIVDAEDRIEAFLPALDDLIDEGLVTLERVRVIAYRHSKEHGS